MPTALFRFDGGPEIGIGHVMRCRALRAAFASLGWHCWSAMTQSSAALFADATSIVVPSGLEGADVIADAINDKRVDCLVVDHYSLDERFERKARGACSTVLVIDDLADRPHDCDLLLDTGPERKAADYQQFTKPGVRFLLGPQYALLRPEFAVRRSLGTRPPPVIAERLLVTLGGADPNNVSERVLEALSMISSQAIKTTLVIGPANLHRDSLVARATAQGIETAVDPPDLTDLMANADMVVAASGSTCWELACLGIPALVIVIADNQRAVAHAMERAGAALVIGDRDHFDLQKVADAIEQLTRDRTRRRRLSSAGRDLIDGLGANRVAKTVAEAVAAKKMEMHS